MRVAGTRGGDGARRGGRGAGAALGAVLALSGCGGDGAATGPACADPERGPVARRFTEVTAASGVEFEYTTLGFQGGGLAVADLDGDGLPELVAGRREGGAALFRNRGGLRFERDGASGVPADAAVRAIAAADLDNDGDRDLVLAGPGVARVLANAGDGTFTEVAHLDTGSTEHVLPVDLDGDGRLDLHFASYDLRFPDNTQNRLFLARGAPLAFALAEVPGAGLAWTATALDFDGDGDQDLYVANDTLRSDAGKRAGGGAALPPWPVDLLLRNDGPGPDGAPVLVDIAAEVGLAEPRSSMGGVLADVDDDGRLDLYVPDFGANKLFVGDAGAGFADRAAALGLDAPARHNAACEGADGGVGLPEDCLLLTWSAALADLDLDGHDEVLLANGETSPGDLPPVLLLARGDSPPYGELASEIPCGDVRALLATDLDGDGDPEAVLAPRQGPLAIYENRGRPAAARWLRVVLRGEASNRDGIGALVAARLASGRVIVRAVGAGGVIHAAAPAEAVFGLGDDAVAELEVRWPSGARTVVPSPAPGGTLVVAEAASIAPPR